jgi:hypothetical protein
MLREKLLDFIHTEWKAICDEFGIRISLVFYEDGNDVPMSYVPHLIYEKRKAKYEKRKVRLVREWIHVGYGTIASYILDNEDNLENLFNFIRFLLRHEMGHAVDLRAQIEKHPTPTAYGRGPRLAHRKAMEEFSIWKETNPDATIREIRRRYIQIPKEFRANKIAGYEMEDILALEEKVHFTHIYSHLEYLVIDDLEYDMPPVSIEEFLPVDPDEIRDNLRTSKN